MKHHRRAGACAAAIAALCASSGHASELTRGPEAALYSAPKTYNGTFSGIDGDSTLGAPKWYFAQWGIPTALVVNKRVPPNTNWKVANSSASIQYDESAKRYELAENGNQAALACGAEQDLFLAPNDAGTYKGYPTEFVPSSPLDTLSHLLLNVGVQVTGEQLFSRCSVNYAGYTVAFVLTNPTKGQTLFYQVIFRDSRNIAISQAWCPGYESSNDGSFCVDDGLQTVYGQPWLAVAEGRRTFSLDLLPPIKAVIQSGHTKAHAPQTIDTNLADWTVKSMYYGSLLQGGAVPTSQWDSVRLEQQQP